MCLRIVSTTIAPEFQGVLKAGLSGVDYNLALISRCTTDWPNVGLSIVSTTTAPEFQGVLKVGLSGVDYNFGQNFKVCC